MKTNILIYAGLFLAVAGIGLMALMHSDPDAFFYGVPMLVAGLVLFVENLKRGIAKEVAKTIHIQEWERKHGAPKT